MAHLELSKVNAESCDSYGCTAIAGYSPTGPIQMSRFEPEICAAGTGFFGKVSDFGELFTIAAATGGRSGRALGCPRFLRVWNPRRTVRNSGAEED